MNTHTQKNTVLFEKALKLRFILPLLVLGYVGLGGFVVPRVDIAAGHVIMAMLAAASVVVTVFAFLRYDSAYRSPSHHKFIFTTAVVVGLYLVGTTGFHIICVLSGLQDENFLFLAEALLVAFGAVAVLMYAKE